eukprot:2693371-Amphidinium_carterae.1
MVCGVEAQAIRRDVNEVGDLQFKGVNYRIWCSFWTARFGKSSALVVWFTIESMSSLGCLIHVFGVCAWAQWQDPVADSRKPT